jgi:hypothetical protein
VALLVAGLVAFLVSASVRGDVWGWWLGWSGWSGWLGSSFTVPASAATWRDGFLASSGSDCAVVHP